MSTNPALVNCRIFSSDANAFLLSTQQSARFAQKIQTPPSSLSPYNPCHGDIQFNKTPIDVIPFAIGETKTATKNPHSRQRLYPLEQPPQICFMETKAKKANSFGLAQTITRGLEFWCVVFCLVDTDQAAA
jgi:hypothetical protein